MRRRLQVARVLFLITAFHVSSAIAQSADSVITTNSIGMTLVEIPSGEFVMGAEEELTETLKGFPYCSADEIDGELPRHKVRISKSFLMGQHEVTLKQFLEFRDAAHYRVEIERDGKPSWGYENENGKLVESNRFRPWDPLAWKIEMDHPVIYVSWFDAVAFCNWLSNKEGRAYRLPTEAEWEYACRAGSNRRYHFGNNLEEFVRFANSADAERKVLSPDAIIVQYDKTGKRTETAIPFPFVSGSDGYRWTAPVGKFQPNRFGLYDMHGNVWEWCSDWYDAKYYARPPLDDPQGPAAGLERVVRGGGFDNPPVDLRCARRGFELPSSRNYFCGFRVVCVR